MIKTILILLLSFSLNLSAQDYGDYPKIKREKLLRDLDLLYQGLDKFHSGMYWYTPKDSVNQAFMNAEKLIDRDLDILQFHKIIAPLVSLSREDHTDVFLPENINKKIRRDAQFIPLVVKFLGDDLYCVRNGSSQNIDIVGKKILAINGLSPLQIVESLGQLFASDGYIKEVKKNDLREFRFSKNYYYYFGNQDKYAIQFEDSTIELDALTIPTINENLVRRSKTAKKSTATTTATTTKDCLEFKIIDESIAYIAVHDFDNGTIKENKVHKNYKAFLSKSFEKIDELGIKHLILDVSKNGGGSEGNDNTLYSYFGDQYQKYIKVSAKTQKAVLDNKVDDPIVLKTFGFFEKLLYNKKMEDGSYERKNKPGIGLMSHKKDPKFKFKGDVYVLISPFTYSGASELSNMLYTNEIGTFIGQETGGGYYGNTSGYTRMLTLPHSKIQIEIPALKFEMNVKDLIPFGRGVLPHHEVIPTFDEHIKGEHAALTYALKLIQSK